MAYFDICEHCGATLDPGEKCTCEKETEIYKSKLSKLVEIDKSGQISLKVG